MMAWIKRRENWIARPGAARERKWPEGAPLPQYYPRRPDVPCPECRLIVMLDGRRAAVVRAAAEGVVYLRCQSCGHSWQMEAR